MAAHARDVNILIWTSRKSVDDRTNDRVMVHGDVTRADGRMSGSCAKISEIMRFRVRGSARHISGSQSNVVVAQPGYLARTTTKAPETQIYFINYRSGANSVPRVRTVVRGERGRLPELQPGHLLRGPRREEVLPDEARGRCGAHGRGVGLRCRWLMIDRALDRALDPALPPHG